MHITRHTKGLALTLEAHDWFTRQSLQQLLGVPVASIGHKQYLVEFEDAAIVFSHFPVERAVWDPKLLEVATRQMQRQQDQLRARIEVDYAIHHADTILSDYPLRERLDPHQREAVAAIVAPSLQGIAIFDEQGTGKTVMALCGYDYLSQSGQVDRLVVVAPKSVLGSWERDAQMLFDNQHRVTIVDGSANRRRAIILSSFDILALSYETVATEESLLTTMLGASTYRTMLVVDESYYVKNPSARRTCAVTKLRRCCTRAIILCGTPAPNIAKDIVQQINIADEGATFGRRVIPDDRVAARSVIAEALESAIYLRRLKHEVLPNVPSKEIQRITFALQPEQRRLYNTELAALVNDIRSVDEATFIRQRGTFLSRRIHLLQICSDPHALDPTYQETPAKFLVLDRLLHELIHQAGKKVVIWSYFRRTLDALAERYSSFGLVRIDGSVVDVEARMTAITLFQQNPSIKVFLGNAAAAGAGITLTSAHHAIYESFSNQAAHYMQSVDRIHRRGQTHDVTYHVLLSEDTIESIEFDRILSKERMSRDLLGDVYEEPITRERFLFELGAVTG